MCLFPGHSNNSKGWEPLGFPDHMSITTHVDYDGAHKLLLCLRISIPFSHVGRTRSLPGDDGSWMQAEALLLLVSPSQRPPFSISLFQSTRLLPLPSDALHRVHGATERVMGSAHTGLFCLAHTEIPDSQKDIVTEEKLKSESLFAIVVLAFRHTLPHTTPSYRFRSPYPSPFSYT